jgi:hypothetical protein
MKQWVGLLLSACIGLIVSPASGEDSISWTPPEVNGWFIAVDTTVGNGCFIYSIFEGDTYARIGFNPQMSSFYLLVGDLDWNSIEAGKEYNIELQMGQRPSWTAPAIGGRLGDVPNLIVTSRDPAFVDEFARQHYIRVWYEGREVANLSLEGSAAAIDEMLRCQQAINEYGGSATPASNDDPFQQRSSKDPFAR